MEKLPNNLILFCVILGVFSGFGVQGSTQQRHHQPGGYQRLNAQKLFVFGDSYADTGNLRKLLAKSWKEPYGITFPGKPTGRFSDGRVLTDYLASLVGLKSPIPYRWRKIGLKALRNGINFAYGGTGVFNTLVPLPNITSQIDLFEQVIEQGVYSLQDIQRSIAVVSIAGNDYITYLANNGSINGIEDFITTLINQLSLDLKRINDLGVRKIAVTGIEPLGCLPSIAATSSYQKCNDTANEASVFHNLLLEEAVANLNKVNTTTIVILDLYQAFMSILQNSSSQGRWKFESPLKPCCNPISSAHDCGSVDENGKKMYTVCEDPESAFFWDSVHPSQMGWNAISSSLKATLYSLSF